MSRLDAGGLNRGLPALRGGLSFAIADSLREFNPVYLFAANEPGWVYDNSDYQDPNAWRVNLLLWSENYSNAVWLKTNVTVTADAALAPDGTMTADKIEATASVGTSLYQVSAAVSGSAVVGFFHIKQGSGATDANRFVLRNGTTATNLIVGTINLTTGEVTITTGSASNVTVTATAQGFWYVELRAPSGFSPTNVAHLYVCFGGASETAGEYAYVWGAQVNDGATAKPYQPITDFNSDYLAAFPNTTIFADAGGTAPALLNGPAGMQLDKSRGLIRGAELLVNGDFAAGFTGWTPSVTGANSITLSGNAVRFLVTGADTAQLVQAAGLVTGKVYETSFDVLPGSTGQLKVLPVGASGEVVFPCTPGRKRFVSIATAASFVISRVVGQPADAYITNISVREVTGNHRYQTTAASRPTLRGTPTGANLITNGDFSGGTANWTSANGGTLASPSSNLEVTNGAASLGRAYQGIATVIGNVYRLRATASRGTATTAQLGWGTTPGSTGGGSATTTSTTGVQLLIYFTATATTTYIVVGNNDTTLGATSYFDNVDLYDVSSGSVTAPYGLQYDGVDDFMQTASVDFTATDAVNVCMGVRKFSDASAGALMELSVNGATTNGALYLHSPTSVSTSFTCASRGTALALSTYADASVAAPITVVQTGLFDISTDTSILRINGIARASSATDQGTGNYGNHAFYFGRRGGSSLPFNGLDFGGVLIGRTLSAADLTSVERWTGQRTGVTI